MNEYNLPSGLKLVLADNNNWCITDDYNTDYLIVYKTDWTKISSYFYLSPTDIAKINNILIERGII